MNRPRADSADSTRTRTADFPLPTALGDRAGLRRDQGPPRPRGTAPIAHPRSRAAGVVGPARGPSGRPPVRPRGRSEWPGPGCRPTLLPPLRPDRTAQRAIPARHRPAHADRRLEGGRPGSTLSTVAAPVGPGLAPSDQEADAVADPENSERPQQGRAGSVGQQPDQEGEEAPGRWQTRASCSTAFSSLRACSGVAPCPDPGPAARAGVGGGRHTAGEGRWIVGLRLLVRATSRARSPSLVSLAVRGRRAHYEGPSSEGVGG